MSNTFQQNHWESVYNSKDESGLSWTQSDPIKSLDLIQEVCPHGRVIDIGGGTSALAGRLLQLGYVVAVLDISEAALQQARKRLGEAANRIEWVQGDVTQTANLGVFDLWHDRALFHFLTDPADRIAYRRLLSRTIRPGGHAIIATFSLEGPEKCSGLAVRRYSGETLVSELGEQWTLLKSVPETHRTPWGQPQAFQYSVFRRNLD